MTGMPTIDAAREAARQPSGQFGAQYRPEATTTLTRRHCIGCGSTWDVVDGFCEACDLDELDDFDDSCEVCGTFTGVHDGICDACWEDEQDLADIAGGLW